jgi:hypothetical protein
LRKRAAEALRTYGQPLAGKLLQLTETEDAQVSHMKEKIAAPSG